MCETTYIGEMRKSYLTVVLVSKLEWKRPLGNPDIDESRILE
jgi:hypothetical protein